MRQVLLFSFFILTFFTVLSAQNNNLRFDGVDDYVQVNDLSLPPSFTVEYQFKAGNNSLASFEERIIGVGPSDRLELGLAETSNGTQLWVFDQNYNVNTTISNINPRDGAWHHLAFTQGEEMAKMYYDGVLVLEYVINSENDLYGPNLRIGAWTGGISTNTFFNGDIDEVRIWAVARSAEEIASALNCQISGEEEGLLAYWDFNQGEAGNNNVQETTLVDRTSNRYDGVISDSILLQGDNSNWVDSGNADVFCDFVSSTHELRRELWSVYPNPTASIVQVKGVNAEKTTLTIYNQQGTRLQQHQLTGTQEVDLSEYPTGLYILTLTQESGHAVYRVIKS